MIEHGELDGFTSTGGNWNVEFLVPNWGDGILLLFSLPFLRSTAAGNDDIWVGLATNIHLWNIGCF